VFSTDEQLGMVHVPLDNRTPDQLGKYRSGARLSSAFPHRS
jgi:glucose dehydrogenase